MGIYQVSCASRQVCPADSGSVHITGVGIDGPDAHQVVEVGVARLMLSSGDTLTIGPPMDAEAELRKTRCACGTASLRTRRRDDDADLAALPDCR